MRKGLRKIAQVFPGRTGLLRIQPQVIGMAEHLLEDQPRLIEPLAYLTDQSMKGRVVGPATNRHKVHDFADGISGQESRHEDIRFRPVELLVRFHLAGARNLKFAPF